MATQYAHGKIVTDGLILCLDAADPNSYPGSGTTWYDVAGTNNGTLTNGPTYSDGSIVFDGVDDYGTVGQASDFQVNNLTIDIGLTLQETLPSGEFRGFFSTVYEPSGYQLFWHRDEYFYFYRSSIQIRTDVKNYQSGDILNLVVTYNYLDASKSAIYINGVNNTFGTPTANSNSNTSYSPIIGGPRADFLNNAFYLASKHHFVRFYNRALTADEVAQNYNAQKARFGL